MKKTKKTPAQKNESRNKPHILLISLGIFFGLYALLPWLAPIARNWYIKTNNKAALLTSTTIYSVYKHFCHQKPSRSIFLFGEKWTYTTEELKAYGYNPHGLIDLPYDQDFIGNTELGYKVAYCTRDVGIYTVFWLVLSVFLLFPQLKIFNLPFWVKALLMLPMIIDGGIQFIATLLWVIHYTDMPFYESTNIKRLITGSLFGLGFALVMFPLIKKTLEE